MPSSIPFVRPMRPESSSRITDLLLQRGDTALQRADARANAELRRGDVRADALAREGAATAQLWSGIANTAGNVLQTVAAGQEQERHDAATQRARDEANQIDEAIRLTPRDEQGRTDPAAVAREIEHIDPVKALDWWRRADDADKTKLASERELGERVAKSAGSLLLDLERTHPTQRQGKWTSARQQAIDSGLTQAEQMPEQVDMGWLRSTFDQARSVESIARDVQAIGEKDDEDFTLGPGQVRYNASGEVIAHGPEKTSEPARAGTFEAFVDAEASDKGRPLTQAEILKARRQWTGAGRTEPRESGGISQAQRAAAIRWRDNETRLAKRTHRDATADLDPTRFPDDKPRLDTANQDLQDEIARIDLSYREQIGDASTEASTTPPPGAPGRTGSHTTPPPSPAPGATPSAATPAPAAPTPPVRPNTAVDPAVEAMLKREGPGEYDLEDGSTWRVTRDGRVERVK